MVGNSLGHLLSTATYGPIVGGGDAHVGILCGSLNARVPQEPLNA